MGAHRGWDERQRLVREWGRSGLSASAFAKSRGIHAGTLRAWRRALRDPQGPRAPRRGASHDIEFIELPTLGQTGLSDTPRVELSVGSRRLTCFSSWSPKELAAFVRALEDDA